MGSENDVIDSCEFQIGLRPVEDWKDRNAMLDRWIASMNRYSKYLNLSTETAVSDIYSQFHLETSGKNRCDTPSDFKMRIRSYFFGGNTVIDVKGGEDPEPKDKS